MSKQAGDEIVLSYLLFERGFSPRQKAQIMAYERSSSIKIKNPISAFHASIS
jgi:hypothetical protein